MGNLAVGLGHHGWPAAVRLLTHAQIERNCAEERHFIVGCDPGAAAAAEYLAQATVMLSSR